MAIQPYIGDEAVRQYLGTQIIPAYDEAQHPLDADYPIWAGRAVYDHAVGSLSWERSCAKHLRECREALGLPTPIPPTPPVTDTWPRLGLSYYTSLTDPRLDLAGFAARLRDAGADYTRVWLMDAWAVRASGGTGCYDGYVPWQRASDGRFDLWNLHPQYLDRLRGYVEQMNAVGVLPQLSGWELYSWSTRKAGMLWVPDANNGPFRHNRQGVYYADDTAFDRIAQPSGEDAFLGHFYRRVVQVLDGTSYTVELANEMPEKALHERLAALWRTAGYLGSLSVNRQDDTPGQYSNMKIGQPGGYQRIAYHGKKDLAYLDEAYPDEPVYKTFRDFYASKPDFSRIILSSDGCRKSTNVEDAYDYDALAVVAKDILARGGSFEHQSCAKLRGFSPENRIDINDLEVDWLRQFAA